MKRKFYLAALILGMGTALNLSAQDNLLTDKPIYPLGEAMTWTNGDASYTFVTEDLAKLVQEPTNTSNVFLYPENGAINNEENQAKGAQPFYIDLGTSTAIGSVFTTWEGAAADSYNIFLTDEEPTLDILSTTPTFSISGLGQYTSTTAVLPDNSKGRYLVFQVTKATNWGWGVKIRSISAAAPQDDELTVFSISPSIVQLNEETPLNLTIQNQLGIDIAQDLVEILVSENAIYDNGNILIREGNSATMTAKMNDVTIEKTIYVATAPVPPAASQIKTPIYTNTASEFNSEAEFVTDWNGGAVKMGELVFANGEVAQGFSNSRCIFFSNKETTGAWNGNIFPQEKGYRTLNLDVFSAYPVECTIEFETADGLDGHTFPYTLNEGEWNSISVDISKATLLGNLSIRFTENNMDDILLSNIYFTPTYVEGDEDAPVISNFEGEATMTSIQLSFTATDDLSPEIYYSISDGVNTYATSGPSGEETIYTVTGLTPNTSYTFTLTASDGRNISDPMDLEISTEGMPLSPEPTVSEEKVIVIFSNHYNKTELPAFDSWGSTAQMGLMEEGENTYLQFTNYLNQWGGLVNLDVNVEDCKNLNMDVFADVDGQLTIAPVWRDAEVETPNKTINITGGEWNTISTPLVDFGFNQHGNDVIQIALTNSTLGSFLIDNLYFESDKSLSVVELIGGNDSELVNVYNLQGVAVRTNAKSGSALTNLPAGIYIVNGKKFIVK